MRFIRPVCLAAIVITFAGCYEPPAQSDRSAYREALKADAERREAAWQEADRVRADDQARREKAWVEAETIQEREKELQARQEALLAKQEEQAARFDAILQKWESASAGGDN